MDRAPAEKIKGWIPGGDKGISYNPIYNWFKGQWGVPLTVYPGYLLCSTLGFLGIITHKYPVYRAYIGISHKGTLVGVHPTIP